jgi:16S rRNA (cytosine1402-N4)-methyltransferase
MSHVPVLQKEVLKYLNPKPNENFVDCTIGEGGHTKLILEKNGPKGKVLGIEIDRELYQILKKKMEQFSERVILVNDSYLNLKKILKKYKFEPEGILFDLGLSSWHLQESKRGFSFLRNEPLDMRYKINFACKTKTKSKITHFGRSPKKCYQLTAKEIVNNWSESEIEKILKEYSQERFAKRIAKRIVKERKRKPIETTFDLVEIIKKATPKWYHFRKIHPATKTFQVLRIVVNDELNNLKKGLAQAMEVLKTGGRLVVISFHSLEDKIVKIFFREKAKENLLKILTKKPVRPTEKEIKKNPRARSARLRAAIKIKS